MRKGGKNGPSMQAFIDKIIFFRVRSSHERPINASFLFCGEQFRKFSQTEKDGLTA